MKEEGPRPLGDPSPETEVDEEVEFHVRMRTRELVRRGMSEEEARAEALARFGDVESIKAECRTLAREREARMRRRSWAKDLVDDAAYGVRQLRRNPGFALVTVLTLALGIGANTAVFSAVDGVLLEPLPYDEPGELVAVWTRYLPRSGMEIDRFPASVPEILDYRGDAAAVEEVGIFRVSTVTLGGETGEPRRVETGQVDHRVLPLLGVDPARGRAFTAEDDVPGAAPTVVLSHHTWADAFGADPGALGSTVSLDGVPARVVGVMPEGFVFPDADVDLWVPLRLDEADPPPRGNHAFRAVGRLAAGETLRSARAELETITAAWSQEWEHHAIGHHLVLESLKDDVVGAEARTILLLLLGAVGLVLLVACANVANLLLVRAEARQGEMAVRASLGAGRGRLARQLMVESGVLAGAGALLGLALASFLTGALLQVDPTALPRAGRVEVDGSVLAFTGGLGFLTALVFGLVPVLHLDRASLAGRGGSRGGSDSSGARRFRRLLVAGEVAMSLMVVTSAALLVRSLGELAREDVGVESRGILTFALSLPETRYADAAEAEAFWSRLTERLRGLPGVEAASATSWLPVSDGCCGRWDFVVDGTAPPDEGEPAWNADVAVAAPGYFETLGVPLLTGRSVRRGDGADSEPVVVVSREMARTFFGVEDAVGRQIRFGGENATAFRIVGVVGDVRHGDLRQGPRPRVYLPLGQVPYVGGRAAGMSLVVRTRGDAASAAPGAREAVRELDPSLPVTDVRTMEGVVDGALARPRFATWLLGGFSLLALALAAVGVYGVVSYSVARRTREIGIRMALGADRRSVGRKVVVEGAAPALVGAVVGLPLAAGATGLFADLLYGVGPRDPAVFGVVAALLLSVAAAASWIPAARATRIAPGRALRED